jgi:HK97 family phage major capsid protein
MSITFPELDAAQAKLTAKQHELGAIFKEGVSDGKLDLSLVKSLDGDNYAKAAEIQKRNDELTDLSKSVEALKGLRAVAASVEGFPTQTEAGDERRPERRESKSLSRQFLDSPQYKARGNSAGPMAPLNVDVKTVLSTTAGFAPDDVRLDDVVGAAIRPVELVDLIPKFATNQASITWMEQTTRTNAAAETAEAGAKPEATIVYTERTSVVRKIAVTLPVTDEQLADVPQMESILRDDLILMVRQRLSDQIASGDGSAPNLRGILNTSGIQTQAKGTDPVPDAVYKAMVLVMTTGQANPDAFVTNPLDWQDVRLLRTADGIYIWGNPSEAGPERIWGLRVVLAQGMTQNTGVVGDWAGYARLALRQDVTFDIGYVNDDFSKNKHTLRAELRAALFFRRPAAFCSVTGI